MKKPFIACASKACSLIEPVLSAEAVEPAAPVNKGTGAGGAQTNANGKAFEEKTCHLSYLGGKKCAIPGKRGKNDVYYEKQTEDGSITYLSQGGIKSYFKWKFEVEMERHPDEAYLIQKGNHYALRVVEKKNQNVDGSVEDKLMTGLAILHEYKDRIEEAGIMGWKVEYAYCLSPFLKKKYQSEDSKWKSLRKFNQQYGIEVFFGEEEDYHRILDAWITKPY